MGNKKILPVKLIDMYFLMIVFKKATVQMKQSSGNITNKSSDNPKKQFFIYEGVRFKGDLYCETGLPFWIHVLEHVQNV